MNIERLIEIIQNPEVGALATPSELIIVADFFNKLSTKIASTPKIDLASLLADTGVFPEAIINAKDFHNDSRAKKEKLMAAINARLYQPADALWKQIKIDTLTMEVLTEFTDVVRTPHYNQLNSGEYSSLFKIAEDILKKNNSKLKSLNDFTQKFKEDTEWQEFLRKNPKEPHLQTAFVELMWLQKEYRPKLTVEDYATLLKVVTATKAQNPQDLKSEVETAVHQIKYIDDLLDVPFRDKLRDFLVSQAIYSQETITEEQYQALIKAVATPDPRLTHLSFAKQIEMTENKLKQAMTESLEAAFLRDFTKIPERHSLNPEQYATLLPAISHMELAPPETVATLSREDFGNKLKATQAWKDTMGNKSQDFQASVLEFLYHGREQPLNPEDYAKFFAVISDSISTTRKMLKDELKTSDKISENARELYIRNFMTSQVITRDQYQPFLQAIIFGSNSDRRERLSKAMNERPADAATETSPSLELDMHNYFETRVSSTLQTKIRNYLLTRLQIEVPLEKQLQEAIPGLTSEQSKALVDKFIAHKDEFGNSYWRNMYGYGPARSQVRKILSSTEDNRGDKSATAEIYKNLTPRQQRQVNHFFARHRRDIPNVGPSSELDRRVHSVMGAFHPGILVWKVGSHIVTAAFVALTIPAVILGAISSAVAGVLAILTAGAISYNVNKDNMQRDKTTAQTLLSYQSNDYLQQAGGENAEKSAEALQAARSTRLHDYNEYLKLAYKRACNDKNAVLTFSEDPKATPAERLDFIKAQFDAIKAEDRANVPLARSFYKTVETTAKAEGRLQKLRISINATVFKAGHKAGELFITHYEDACKAVAPLQKQPFIAPHKQTRGERLKGFFKTAFVPSFMGGLGIAATVVAIASVVANVTLAGTAAGAVLGGPWGAAIGVGVGLIAGVTIGAYHLYKHRQQQARENLATQKKQQSDMTESYVKQSETECDSLQNTEESLKTSTQSLEKVVEPQVAAQPQLAPQGQAVEIAARDGRDQLRNTELNSYAKSVAEFDPHSENDAGTDEDEDEDEEGEGEHPTGNRFA